MKKMIFKIDDRLIFKILYGSANLEKLMRYIVCNHTLDFCLYVFIGVGWVLEVGLLNRRYLNSCILLSVTPPPPKNSRNWLLYL